MLENVGRQKKCLSGMKLLQLNLQSMANKIHEHPQQSIIYPLDEALRHLANESNSKFYLTTFFFVATSFYVATSFFVATSFLVTNSQQPSFGRTKQYKIQRRTMVNPRRKRLKNKSMRSATRRMITAFHI